MTAHADVLGKGDFDRDLPTALVQAREFDCSPIDMSLACGDLSLYRAEMNLPETLGHERRKVFPHHYGQLVTKHPRCRRFAYRMVLLSSIEMIPSVAVSNLHLDVITRSRRLKQGEPPVRDVRQIKGSWDNLMATVGVVSPARVALRCVCSRPNPA